MRSNPSKKFFGHYMLNSPNWRSQDFVLRGPENRGAIAAEFETPSGDVECPPQPTRGSGAAENGFWCILSLKKNESDDDKCDIFVIL